MARVDGIEIGLIALPVVALAANVLFHASICRVRAGISPFRSTFLAFLGGFAVALVLQIMLQRRSDFTTEESVGYALVNALTYASLSAGYFYFFSMIIASLRLRVCREIAHAPERRLQLDDLRALYAAEAILQARIVRLLRAGALVRDGEDYRPGPNRAILHMARVMRFLKQLILGRREVGTRTESGGD